MFISKSISVSFQWSGTHRWPGAQGTHEYLKHPHRHLFKGRAQIEVFHDDREIEFLAVLDYLNEQVLVKYRNLGERSCEWVAKDIIEHLTNRYGDGRDIQVYISEDGENGAVVRWSGAHLA